MLISAMGSHPYGYYEALRWIVFGAALFVIWNALTSRRGRELLWAIVFVGVAVLFNPLVPITADRGFWTAWDVVCAGLFLISCAIEPAATKPVAPYSDR
jgi:hypothetical protein